MRPIFLAFVVFALVLLVGVALSRGNTSLGGTSLGDASARHTFHGDARGAYSAFGLHGMPSAKHFE